MSPWWLVVLVLFDGAAQPVPRAFQQPLDSFLQCTLVAGNVARIYQVRGFSCSQRKPVDVPALLFIPSERFA